MLRVEQISKSFRGLQAVSQASFNVTAGSIVALIGPNGAGKTTCFNMIAGVFPLIWEKLFLIKEKYKDSGPIRFAAPASAALFRS